MMLFNLKDYEFLVLRHISPFKDKECWSATGWTLNTNEFFKTKDDDELMKLFVDLKSKNIKSIPGVFGLLPEEVSEGKWALRIELRSLDLQ